MAAPADTGAGHPYASLRGKVVLVTGAARGLGRAMAGRFAQAGCRVWATDMDEPGARACANEMGAPAQAARMDVRDPGEVAAAVARILEADGRIDVLVNNAGRMTQGGYADTSHADWNEQLAVNVGGIFNCVQAVAPVMAAQRAGAIVNIGSVSAMRGGGAVGNLWYGATKAAVHAMTVGLARELGRHGVRVNAIAPGVVETDMVRDFLTPQLKEKVLQRFPLGRLATREDVAGLCLFLASDLAAFVTGEAIAVDGGFLKT